MITRNRVLLRARYGWPQATVPFSKTDFHQPSGYRCDAAGFLSMCWAIPLGAPHSWGGMSTLTLESDGWAREIQPLDMKPGDALGLLGPGSVGTDGGTIVLFEGWLNDDYTTNYAITWEQLPDASPGPVRRARPYDRNRWHSYRFRDIVDTD
jgi:hypothetical protein